MLLRYGKQPTILGYGEFSLLFNKALLVLNAIMLIYQIM